MKEGPDIALLGALIGDPARANILTALMSGKALTASELAAEAGITLQTASSHLKKLEAAHLLRQRLGRVHHPRTPRDDLHDPQLRRRQTRGRGKVTLILIGCPQDTPQGDQAFVNAVGVCVAHFCSIAPRPSPDNMRNNSKYRRKFNL